MTFRDCFFIFWVLSSMPVIFVGVWMDRPLHHYYIIISLICMVCIRLMPERVWWCIVNLVRREVRMRNVVLAGMVMASLIVVAIGTVANNTATIMTAFSCTVVLVPLMLLNDRLPERLWRWIEDVLHMPVNFVTGFWEACRR